MFWGADAGYVPWAPLSFGCESTIRDTVIMENAFVQEGLSMAPTLISRSLSRLGNHATLLPANARGKKIPTQGCVVRSEAESRQLSGWPG